MTQKPTIILTRPAGQNEVLKAQLASLSYDYFELPLLKIDFFANQILLEKLQNLTQFDYIIFTSINAIKAVKSIFKPLIKHFKEDSHLFCIGKGSAQYLQALTQKEIEFPEKDYSSEGLLEALKQYPLKNKSVLIVTGENGLAVLQTALQEQRAELSELIVYQRSQPKLTERQLADLPNYLKNSLFVMTSAQSVKNLYSILTDKLSWNSADMLVLSQRIAETLRDLGYQGKIKMPKQSSDAAIVQAITAWHEDEK